MDIFEILSSLLMIICSVFGIICAIIFIIIVAIHSQCQTLNIFLVLNSMIAGFIANTTCVCQGIYQILNIGYDILCPIRGFILHLGTGLLYHTLCVQALHRFLVTLYSTRRSFQTRKFYIFIVILQWLISCSAGLPFFLTGRIRYQSDSRICQIPMEDKWGFIYFGLIIFFFPILIIILIYINIVKYMKNNPFSTTNRSNINTQHRQQSEIRLIRRILMIVIILFILGFPYTFIFIALEIHLIPSCPYITRISYIFITFGQSITMLINLIITDDVRKALINIIMKYCTIRRVQVNCLNVINA